MSFTFLILPPPSDYLRGMAERIAGAVPEAEVVVCEDRGQALAALADTPAAFGTLDAELLAAAPKLRWLAAPAAGPNPSFYFPELVASDVLVTNMRGIYSDHIGAHIMSFVLAFSRHLHHYIPAQTRGEWLPGSESGPYIHCPRPPPSSSEWGESVRRRRATALTSACASSALTPGLMKPPKGCTNSMRQTFSTNRSAGGTLLS